MDPISKAEVQQLRDLADINKLVIAPGEQTRLAILPYMPLQQMSFKSDLPQVQFASELRYKFRQIPSVSVKSPWQVENAVAMCRDKTSSKKEFLNAVAGRLRVDYVLWGDIDPIAGQQVSVSPVLYRRQTGQLTAFKALDIEEHMVPTGRIASGLLKRIVTGDAEMLAALDRQASQILRPVALKSRASGELMGAYDALENALQFLVGSPESNKLFVQAERQLNRTLKDDPQNPLAHYLMANLKFNQAQAAAKRVNKDEAAEAIKQFKRSLEQANRFRNRGKENIPKELALEMAGMYQLLIKKDTKLAIETFESIADTSADSTLHFSRRAHWMLAGIFAGDWNVSPDVVDVVRMREHLIHILAMHEDSPEANHIRKWLRWDSKSGRNPNSGIFQKQIKLCCNSQRIFEKVNSVTLPAYLEDLDPEVHTREE